MELDKIKMVRLQIKRAVSSKKWSTRSDAYSNLGVMYTSYTYIDSIDPDKSINTDKCATIKIVVRPGRKWVSIDDSGGVCDNYVSISIKNGTNWSEFNALYYGFSKFDIFLLRCKLFFKAIDSKNLKYEYRKQISIDKLNLCSSRFIEENRGDFRDATIDKIIN